MVDIISETPLSFIIKFDVLKERLDPRFYSPEYPVSSLRDISISIKSGITPKSKGDSYTDQENGIPFIRSGDLTMNNIVDYDKTLYLKKEIHLGKMYSSRVEKNDILIAIVGATIGKVSIYLDDRESNINQAIAKIKLDSKKIDPMFVLFFLRSKHGQIQLRRLKRPVARANINLAEIGELLIPIPSPEIQEKAVSIMYQALNNIDLLNEKIKKVISDSEIDFEQLIINENV